MSPEDLQPQDPAEQLQALEKENLRFKEQIAELKSLNEEKRLKIDRFENEIEKNKKIISAYKAANTQKNNKIEAYVIFTHILMIILSWAAIPVLCFKTFGFSPLLALVVGFVVYITFLVFNEGFVNEIRNI